MNNKMKKSQNRKTQTQRHKHNPQLTQSRKSHYLFQIALIHSRQTSYQTSNYTNIKNKITKTIIAQKRRIKTNNHINTSSHQSRRMNQRRNRSRSSYSSRQPSRKRNLGTLSHRTNKDTYNRKQNKAINTNPQIPTTSNKTPTNSQNKQRIPNTINHNSNHTSRQRLIIMIINNQ